MSAAPHRDALYAAARARPLRGAAAALLIFAAGGLLRAAEHLLGMPGTGAVLAASAELSALRHQKGDTP